jgi:CubicO group peptidase (beta-lactamase class C family)
MAPTETPPSVMSPSETPAYSPAEEWRTSSPEEQGMDPALLAEMLDRIDEIDREIHSVTVIRNGYMVLDEYYPPSTPDTRHVIRSCTKSVISILIGIAIDEGYIEGIDQPVLSFFPDRVADNLDADKESMTLEDLLTMSSGFDCQDSYLYNWYGLDQMNASDDWAQFVLDLPMRYEPGTHFEYCNGGSHLLSTIVQATTGMSTLDFARERLFGPLSITNLDWETDPQGVAIGYSGILTTPHDMARIGWLYLNHGEWNGEQIVPADWVAESTRAHIFAGTLSDEYGYQWWVDANGYYMAQGYGGQFIYVVPDRNMVVVFTGELRDDDFFIPEGLLNDYIIPAAR